MARVTNGMITYDDANYMITNNGFSRIGSLISGKNCLNKSEILAYMNANPVNFNGYVSNRLVPYHLLTPDADTTAPSQITGFTFAYNVDIDGDGMDDIGIRWSTPIYDNVGVTKFEIAITVNGVLKETISFNGSSNSEHYKLYGGYIDKLEWARSKGWGDGVYAYNIRAGDAVGNWGLWSDVIYDYITIPDITPPSTPTMIGASIVTNKITWKWSESTDNVGVTGYEVWMSTNGSSYGTSPYITVTVLSYSMATVSGQQYWCKVRARDAAGNVSGFSDAFQMCQDKGKPCGFI